MLNGGGAFVSTNRSMYTTLYRNTSPNLGDGTYGFSLHHGAQTVLGIPHSINYLDSPSTTSSITYRVYNRSGTGTNVDYNYYNTGRVVLTAMEIGA